VRPVTYQKYQMTLRRLTELAPDLKLGDIDRHSYQALLNRYAETHVKQTTIDFHHHLRSAIQDARDDGLLPNDPTRKATVKGLAANEKIKFLNLHELKSLLGKLALTQGVNWDWLILLLAKTGMRFSEALALTPDDFDFTAQKVRISKTWNYKSAAGGFAETKNESSKRTISIDPQLSEQYERLVRGLPGTEPVFAQGRVFNSTVNSRLKKLCKEAGTSIIATHGLRHTHASILIFAGVSIASVAKRLGHASVATTQETYLHIIKEMENLDNDKIMSHLSSLMNCGTKEGAANEMAGPGSSAPIGA